MSVHHFNRIVVRSSDTLLSVAKKLKYPLNGRQFSTKAPGDGIPVDKSNDGQAAAATIQINVNKPDREINLFGPRDHRTPLPGNVGLAAVMNRKVATPFKYELAQRKPRAEPDVITEELNVDRQARILDQLVYPRDEQDIETEDRMLVAKEILECTAHSCPELLIKDFRNLFPGVKIGKRLTVVTICQKTVNDMSTWSPEMELERDELSVHFVTLANSIVNTLADDGYWADFIDPLSGSSSASAKTGDTLYETDRRYRNFGFEIEDQGCCKVLTHHEWGSKAFVGSIFTTAPYDSIEILRLVDDVRDDRIN